MQTSERIRPSLANCELSGVWRWEAGVEEGECAYLRFSYCLSHVPVRVTVLLVVGYRATARLFSHFVFPFSSCWCSRSRSCGFVPPSIVPHPNLAAHLCAGSLVLFPHSYSLFSSSTPSLSNVFRCRARHVPSLTFVRLRLLVLSWQRISDAKGPNL